MKEQIVAEERVQELTPTSQGSTDLDPSDGSKVHPNSASSSLARRATGPRTALGKARSRYNAMKHGIFSNAVLLIGESRHEFDSLLDGLRESFQPEGTLEEVLVEKLATLLWRYRRCIVTETIEIDKTSETEVQSKPSRFPQTQAAVRSEKSKPEKLQGCVPISGRIHFLIRYETSIERAFDRTLSQLERLQRIRLGQPVLPAIKLEVSET